MELHPGPEKRLLRAVNPTAPDALRQALHENEDWYQDLAEHSRDLLCIHDLKGRLLSVDPTPARLLGYSVEEILLISMRELIAPEFRPQFETYMRQVERDGEARGFLVVMTRTGERRIWEYHNKLRTDGVAAPIVRGLAHDVTEQKETEKLLREVSDRLLSQVREGERTIQELQLFRTLVDQSNDAIEVVDPETLRFLDVNEKACSDLGYSREELLSLAVPDINPAVGEFSSAKITEMVKKSGCLILERIHRRKDGTLFPVEVSMRWVQLDREYVVVIARDLTERRRAQTRLQEYGRVVEGLDEMILVVNREHRYVLVNPAYLKYRRLANEQVVGRLVPEVLGRELYEAEIKEKLDECFRGKAVSYETNRQRGAAERELSVKYLPIEGATGIDRVACILRDITERKRAEEALRESEVKFRTLYERSPAGICLVDTRTGRFLGANPKYCEIAGRTEQDLLSRDFQSIMHPDDVGRNLEELRQLREGEVRQFEMEKRYLRPDGSTRWVRVEVMPIWAEGEDASWNFAIVQDITERKRAEKALRRSEENYRMFVTQSSEGIFREDVDEPIPIDLPEDELIHRILYDHYMAECNDAMAAMYGFASGRDLLGKRLTEMVVPDDPRNIELTREFIRSGFRVIDRESHEVDIHGNPKVFLNSMIGTVENGMLVRTWGIQRDITEKVKLEDARQKAEGDLRRNVAQLCEVTAELALAREKLSEEKVYLEETIDTELGFGEIVGRSTALKEVMQKVAKVAPSDATVLLLGETGTGKELVARALHRLSKRQGNSFIKMNCAAIPSGLLESELFGHEKGAFTGAVARKPGRLELADKGTLFLDEIGEIPLNLQPKLLRVLQDMEFERLGGTQTLKVNFRLLAATNRELLQSVKLREFRSDLYYRLNVFPILIPPLRERREDIPPLVEHFVRKFSHQMKKSITRIPSRTMESLMMWEWPGNIRELENFVERSVILSSGSALLAPLSELQKAVDEKNGGTSVTLRDKERDRILQALRSCQGKLGGPEGAAARLGLKRTTLQSKLDQFGIKPGTYRA